LKPEAWCYWQPVEHDSRWGLIEADFKKMDGTVTPLGLPQPKYYVLAHFTRFLRKGSAIMHCTKPWATAAFSVEQSEVACVLVNLSNQVKTLSLRLPGSRSPSKVHAVMSEPRRGRFFTPNTVQFVFEKKTSTLKLLLDAPAWSICSVTIYDYQVGANCCNDEEKSSDSNGVTVSHMYEMTIRAARAATNERWLGAAEERTVESWARFEHACCSAAASSGDPTHPPPCFAQLVEVIINAAWGAANERKFGCEHPDARNAWNRFHQSASEVGAWLGETHSADFKWMIFNLAWGVTNARAFGAESDESTQAFTSAEGHCLALGGSNRVLLRRSSKRPISGEQLSPTGAVAMNGKHEHDDRRTRQRCVC